MTAPQPTVALANEALSLTVNGERRTVASGSTVSDLLDSLHLDPRTVVVEHNREILRDRGTTANAKLSDRKLATDDTIEIVHFVGGG